VRTKRTHLSFSDLQGKAQKKVQEGQDSEETREGFGTCTPHSRPKEDKARFSDRSPVTENIGKAHPHSHENHTHHLDIAGFQNLPG
jgi:hypothetical protein